MHKTIAILSLLMLGQLSGCSQCNQNEDGRIRQKVVAVAGVVEDANGNAVTKARVIIVAWKRQDEFWDKYPIYSDWKRMMKDGLE